MSYFNLHRHSPAKDLEETAIINIFPAEKPPEKYLYSVGLHPWHVTEKTLSHDIGLVEAKGKLASAIGECGLDRACNVSFELQVKAFRAQAEIAGRLGKPLIIHCVRAYSDIISEKKQSGPDAAWIIHGFSGNSAIASQLIKHGLFLSFGRALMKDHGLGKILASVPEDRYFLETDESNISIREIYGKAASIRNTDVGALILQQWKKALSL